MASNKMFFTTIFFVLIVGISIAENKSDKSSGSGGGFQSRLTSAFNSGRNHILIFIQKPNEFLYTVLNTVGAMVDGMPEMVDGMLTTVGGILKVPPGLAGKIVDKAKNGMGSVYAMTGKAGSSVSHYQDKMHHCFSNNSNNPVVKAIVSLGDCVHKQVSSQSEKMDKTLQQVQTMIGKRISDIDQMQNVSGLGKTFNGVVDMAQSQAKQMLPTIFSAVKLSLSTATALPGFQTCTVGIVFKQPSTLYNFLKEYKSCLEN